MMTCQIVYTVLRTFVFICVYLKAEVVPYCALEDRVQEPESQESKFLFLSAKDLGSLPHFAIGRLSYLQYLTYYLIFVLNVLE